MKLAILSGKGGTGKTLLSVNLAEVAGASVYLDCDVEEPNGRLFFKPQDLREEEVALKIPQVNMDLCDGCRKCVDFCNFNALAYINKEIKVFEDICHSCGGCVLLCPQKAFTEKDKPIGKLEYGRSGEVGVRTGILKPGLATGVPIIKELLAGIKEEERPVFIDCPPGSACSVMESIQDADYCLLVAEPTIFGLDNFEMVYELVKIFEKDFGVLINKSMGRENIIRDFCLKNQIKIIGEIAYSPELGKINSNGKIAARESESYRELFSGILDRITEEVRK